MSNIECVEANSQINVISSGGNKYVFNGASNYDDALQYGLYNGSYIFSDIPSGHPLAILNNGKLIL